MRKNSSKPRSIRPKLPFKLTKELFGSQQDQHGNHRTSSHASRRERRKEERKLKKTKHISPKHTTPRTRHDTGDHKPTSKANAPSAQRQKKNKTPPQHTYDDDDDDNDDDNDTTVHNNRMHTNKKQKKNSNTNTSTTITAPTSTTNSKFNELLPRGLSSGIDAELELQRQLAKKLGMSKKKKSMGGDDGLDDLLQELGGVDDILGSSSSSDDDNNEDSRSFDSDSDNDDDSDDDEYDDMDDDDDDILLHSSDSDEDQPHHNTDTNTNTNKTTTTTTPSTQKYIPPSILKKQQALQQSTTTTTTTTTTSTAAPTTAEEQRTVRRVRGLLNRLAESNLQGIVTQLADMYTNEGRSVVSHAVCNELISAAAEGPRSSEQFAAVAAASVTGIAGIACSSEPIATFLSQIASSIETAIEKKDSLAYGNVVQVLGQLFLCHAIKADILFDVLEYWSRRFTESDIVCMVTLLRVAGLQLRSADPEKMKEFVIAIHHAAGENNKKGNNKSDDISKKESKNNSNNTLSTRARVMLDLVVDIKNNRKRDAGNVFKVGTLAPVVTKWLKSLKIDGVAIGGISWQKIVNGNKKGMWWMPTAADGLAALAASRKNSKNSNSALGNGKVALKSLDNELGMTSQAPEALLQLAASMRMNTDVRRAVFCAVMGSEDAADACEKLLRLGLKGDMEREIVRVTVECALHESSWNPYYGVLLVRLCGIGKSHKITLQFCFWDHLKRVPEMETRRFTVLAKLMAYCVASSGVPLSILKAVDFNDATMSARETLFWRLFFENMFVGCKKEKDIVAMCNKIAISEQLKELKSGLRSFLKRSVGPWLASKDPNDPVNGGAERLGLLLKRCHTAERALVV